MRSQKLAFHGFENGFFKFKADNGKVIAFKKANKELIEKYALLSNQSIGAWFSAKYFIDPVLDNDIYILCDLDLG